MRIIKTLFVCFATLSFFLSCQKEYSEENGGGGTSIGTLKSSSTGDCLPSTVNGIFRSDVVLTSTNFIDVQADVSSLGAYRIVSDTVNGYSFKGEGIIGTAGLNSIRLYGTGKPLAAGTNTFTISYGASVCLIDVTVVGAGVTDGTFTLGGAPGSCSGAVLNGSFVAGTALGAGSSATLSINVTALGTYTLSATPVNGVTFSGSGVLTSLGAQTITVSASGTPTAAGTFNVPVSNGSSNCTFSFTTTAGGGGGGGGTAAVYTLGGAGSACTGFVINGTYMAGTAMSAGNTVLIDVNVTTAGTYSITTAAVNGVTFSKSGTFTTTGAQTVTLVASGTPTAAATSSYTVTAGTNTCTFPVTFLPAAPPAVFTLAGAPNACTTPAIAGTYSAGTALSSANTVTLTVNVTTAGSYNITTGAVNGMTFSGSGLLSTGTSTIVLTGTGTPTTATSSTFTPSVSGSSCTFSITVTGAATDFIRAKIDGVMTTFNEDIYAVNDNSSGVAALVIEGSQSATTMNPLISLGIISASGASIGVGNYNVNQIMSGIILGADYYDAAGTDFFAGTDPLGTTQTPGFSIQITSATATRLTGTFSGTLKDNNGAGPGVKVVTEGSFSVPL